MGRVFNFFSVSASKFILLSISTFLLNNQLYVNLYIDVHVFSLILRISIRVVYKPLSLYYDYKEQFVIDNNVSCLPIFIHRGYGSLFDPYGRKMAPRPETMKKMTELLSTYLESFFQSNEERGKNKLTTNNLVTFKCVVKI